jgi:hypothetical protein
VSTFQFFNATLARCLGHAVTIQLNATDSCNRPMEAEPAALAALLQLVPPLQVRGTINNTECQLHSRIFQEELQKMKLWALQSKF